MRFVKQAKPTLAALPLVFFLLLAACAKLPFMSPGPGETVKRAMSAFYQGNLEEMAQYLPAAAQADLAKAKATKDSLFGSFGDALEKGVTKVMITAMQQDISSKGGITAFEIDREQITGDTATVDFTIRFGNGTATSNQTRCLKENGVWKLAQNN